MTDGARCVDLAFELRGEFIGRDYPARLWRALSARLDWLEDDKTVAVHPIRGTSGNDARLVLSRRARLVLRLPGHRVAECAALEGATLELDGEVEVGAGIARALQPYPVVYSPLVAMGEVAEVEFMRAVEIALQRLGVKGEAIVGRRREVVDDSAVRRVGYGLMLHGLSAAHSELVQNTGLGGAHRVGCGVFVPHKSIAPVGEA